MNEPSRSASEKGEDLLLAIDAGTQSIRALAFDLAGNLVAKARVPLVPYVSPHPGWAEQDPAYYWRSLSEACQTLFAGNPGLSERIRGVALTTQRATTVCLDGNGEPLRPAIVWLDQRRTEGLDPIRGLWGLAFKLSGMSETVSYFQAEAEVNWLAAHEPEVWKATRHYVLLSGYLTYKLTGRFVDSTGCQVAYIPFDYKSHQWARSWDWKWQALPLDRKQLPEIVPPGQPLGEISEAASAATGLPQGLPVIAAAADKACEVLGAGCLEPDIACLSYGTTATINTTHRSYVEPYPLIPPYPAALPGAYNLEIQIYRGFWMVSWFRQEFGHREEELARERGVAPEVLFDELVADVPPGSMGLILQPYWSPGVKIPGPEAKGAIIGFGDVHTRAHMYRAILEGLAYALREGKERTERRSKLPIREIRVAGGGSQSDAAMQLTADVFNLPAKRPHVYEASGLGAAIVLSVGLGLHPSFEAAVASMTRVGRTFTPDPKTVAIYDRLYERVYKQMYKRLRPLYEEIREITGYPPRPGKPG
ncbi:MAG: FGGY-family carbohydrate kinase [Thermoanaerobaculia bacterium]|nr:FGGY-family carbohydrate kinase [Thermoanaerobaculia bacterium]